VLAARAITSTSFDPLQPKSGPLTVDSERPVASVFMRGLNAGSLEKSSEVIVDRYAITGSLSLCRFHVAMVSLPLAAKERYKERASNSKFGKVWLFFPGKDRRKAIIEVRRSTISVEHVRDGCTKVLLVTLDPLFPEMNVLHASNQLFSILWIRVLVLILQQAGDQAYKSLLRERGKTRL
jgi:hypothetical protein